MRPGGRSVLFGPAPGPVFMYSAKRSPFQEKPPMSVQGVRLIAALSLESRTVAWGSAALSPPGGQLRPRWKEDAVTSPLMVKRLMRMP